MGRLNKNNFLYWDGSFNAAPANNVANDDVVAMLDSDGSLDISILSNDTSTYGIDFSSIIVTLQDNLTTPATWNPSTKKLTYFFAGSTGIKVIKYKWADVYGNLSNEASVSINVTARPMAWRAYPASYSCVLDDIGHRTGKGAWAQLQKYYTDDSTNVYPFVLKPNAIPGILKGEITTEGGVPGDPTFVDVDLHITDTAAPVIDLYAVGIERYAVAAGNGVRFSIANVTPGTGINPLLHLQVYKNGALVYQKSIPATAGAGTYYDVTVDENALYYAKAHSESNGTALADVNIADTFTPIDADSISPIVDAACVEGSTVWTEMICSVLSDGDVCLLFATHPETHTSKFKSDPGHTVGMVIANTANPLDPATDGLYSDGDFVYTVFGGSGVVTNISSCS